MKSITYILLLIATSLIFNGVVWAECQDGKSEVAMTLPNGNVKAICLPEAALPGLENAAENSDAGLTCDTLSVQIHSDGSVQS